MGRLVCQHHHSLWSEDVRQTCWRGINTADGIGFVGPEITVLVLRNLHVSNRKERKKKSPLIDMI